MPTSELSNAKEAIPLIGIGVTGAIVRSINHQPFSVRDAAVRVATSGFTSGLAYLYLSTTGYPRARHVLVGGLLQPLGPAELYDDVARRVVLQDDCRAFFFDHARDLREILVGLGDRNQVVSVYEHGHHILSRNIIAGIGEI